MVSLRSRSDAILGIAREGTKAQGGSHTEALLAAEQAMSAPLLIIAAGASDVPEGEDFVESLASLAERYPYASYHLIPDAPHYVMVTNPEETAELIESWIDEAVVLFEDGS